MPKKKKTQVNTLGGNVTVETPKDAPQEQIAEQAKDKFCNHQNLHAQGEVFCILPKGHAGNHSNGLSDWSDAAGTPARRHA